MWTSVFHHHEARNGAIDRIAVSSRDCGNRAVVSFGDYFKVQGAADIQSVSLLEGIVRWVHTGPEYTEHIEGFDTGA